MKQKKDFQNCCVVFDDKLDSNQRLKDPFSTKGRHNDLDVYYLSQSIFDLPKRNIRNISNVLVLFQQTLKDVEHIYKTKLFLLCFMMNSNVYAEKHGTNTIIYY